METNSTNEQDDGLQPFFDSPFLTFVKSFTMFVGELEFSDIPIDRSSSLMPLSYIYFLSFVLLIVVVLMNLLNGLAVSDIRSVLLVVTTSLFTIDLFSEKYKRRRRQWPTSPSWRPSPTQSRSSWGTPSTSSPTSQPSPG